MESKLENFKEGTRALVREEVSPVRDSLNNVARDVEEMKRKQLEQKQAITKLQNHNLDPARVLHGASTRAGASGPPSDAGSRKGDPRQVVGRTGRNLLLDNTEQTVKVLINDISGHHESEEVKIFDRIATSGANHRRDG
eukprot:3498875-Pyramimonas_sp.AAC.1